MKVKLLIWTISLGCLGLLALFEIGEICMTWAMNGFTSANSQVHHHHLYLKLGAGPNAVPIYPRIWASSLTLFGIVVVLAGQFFILRRGWAPDLETMTAPTPLPDETAV